MSQDETKDYTPAAPATPREQTKQDGLRTTQQPSGLKQLISLGIPLTRFVMYPMDQIRLIGSSLKQMVGKKFDPEKDVCDQTGKVILITGGNTGLGKETVLQLAKHNPGRIYLAARNASKGEAAIADIQKNLSRPTDIRYLPLDLSSFASIYAAAKKFTAESERLDTLILNAGVMDPAPHTTEQGHEIHIGTNHIGHFLLTKLLLPTLLKTASGRTSAGQPSDVRVITVASMAWQMSPPLSNLLSTEALLASHSYARYGASKAAIIAFASELARRYPQLTSVSLHPGVIFTGLYDSSRAMSGALRIAINAAKPFTIDEKQGSLNHLWAAGSEKEKLTSGEYYTPVGVGGWKNVWADDEEVGRKLWEWSEEEVSEHQKD